MAAKKIRSNDKVIVINGKYKGKLGIVKRIFPNNKVIVEGINLCKKHKKPLSENDRGGIIEKENVIDISNIAIFNEKNNKSDKIGFKNFNGKKKRILKSNGSILNKI